MTVGVAGYGVSVRYDAKLFRDLGIFTHEALALLDEYMSTYPAVRRFYEEAIAETEQTGFSYTIIGRRRFHPEIISTRDMERWSAQRAAVNNQIQGGAADVVRFAQLNIDAAGLEEHFGCEMLMQVHDELVFRRAERDRASPSPRCSYSTRCEGFACIALRPILPAVPSDDSPDDINRRAQELRPVLYPELETEDITSLVRRLLTEADRSLDALGKSGLRRGHRSAQVLPAALERLFLFVLWNKGVCYGQGKTNDLRTLAEVIGAFVFDGASVDAIAERYPWFEFNESARPHEAGRLTDARWSWMLRRDDDVGGVLALLLRACSERPKLRALFPFTSHETLLFSHTTGYPYEIAPACARPVYDEARQAERYIDRFVTDRYEVFLRDAAPTDPASPEPRSLGIGDARWAADVLEREVPPHWEKAVDGTAEDAEPASS